MFSYRTGPVNALLGPVTRKRPDSVVQVHHRGERGVDGILRLIELAGHDGSVEAMLNAMCDQIATIAGVDIASVYVREGDHLVMRGNHGFPRAALGTTLDVGEGITGLVAECMRPVSAAHASDESAYKPVPGINEEEFPVFVGVPLIGGGTAIGVLVLQRREEPFASGEVTLATALGAPVTLAIERRRATAARSARLHGVVQVPGSGAVLGRVASIPTATALGTTPPDVERALARLSSDLGRAVKKLDGAPAEVAGALDRIALTLMDQRFRERVVASIDDAAGLRGVAKEYARAPYRLGAAAGDAAIDRTGELEELCVVLGTTALRPGAVWIADRVGVAMAIVAIARGAAAIAIADVATPAAIAACVAAKLPLVTDVDGLFGWVRPGDLVAVDGDAGEVLVHPSPTEIERLRAAARG